MKLRSHHNIARANLERLFRVKGCGPEAIGQQRLVELLQRATAARHLTQRKLSVAVTPEMRAPEGGLSFGKLWDVVTPGIRQPGGRGQKS
jgi:hypothetical protein